MKHLLTITALLCVAFSTRAQELNFNLPTGYSVKMNGLGSTICQASGTTITTSALSFLPAVSLGDLPQSEGAFHHANAGQPFTMVLDIPDASVFANMNDYISYRYGTANGNIPLNTYISVPSPNPPSGFIRFEFPVMFELGEQYGYLTFIIAEYQPAQMSALGHRVVIPITVLGPTTSEVPILGSTTQPQIPYLILHAPPGDGSSSEFQDSKTTCREFTDSYAEDGSNSFNLAAKIGVAGSLGFIATVDYEFSVTFSGGATIGDMSVRTSSNQTCVTVSEGFNTTEITGPTGGGDVFIGYGTDLNLGLYPYLRVDSSNCDVVLDSGLIYMATGQPRKFAYTKTAILSEMETLQQIIADSATVGPKITYNSQNQLRVWEQVLAMNEANLNNPGNVPIGSDINFSSGVSASQESAITIVETNAIEVEHYIEGNIGVEVVIEVGGSGVSGGYQYNTSKRFGKSQNQSDEVAQLIRYTLADDDPGDLFKINVVRDPMFGTPIFRTITGTKSSCPYQGGYQRDQPRLRHDGTTDNHIVSSGNPVGGSATFYIDICNESNEARNYYLKLNANSNPNNAEVRVAGALLNGNDLGQLFTVPASSCLENYEVSVKQASQLSYPNLELFLYPECNEDDIQSSVFASVYFGNASGVNENPGNLARLSVFPQPAANVVNVAFELVEPAPLRLTVNDIMGRLLWADTDENCPAGSQQKQLNIIDLPAGIYILGIQSGEERHTCKLIVE
ncbi:MAG: T9SS type A sorting domain-containing protein [Saprospiraceae bacterium]|nr:T9SS type A sorting domain-containing protein [Saprospiraceae bacterium]